MEPAGQYRGSAQFDQLGINRRFIRTKNRVRRSVVVADGTRSIPTVVSTRSRSPQNDCGTRSPQNMRRSLQEDLPVPAIPGIGADPSTVLKMRPEADHHLRENKFHHTPQPNTSGPICLGLISAGHRGPSGHGCQRLKVRVGGP
jgi:hypothetical protein